jgi:methionyl-tRNA synthetase
VWLHEYLEFSKPARCVALCFDIKCSRTKDNDFTWKDGENNNELRFTGISLTVVVLTNKYYNGIVPQPNELSEVDEATLTELKAYPAVISSSVERYRFREALGELMNSPFRK